MRFSLNEPPSWAKRTVGLNFDKPAGDDFIEITHGDNDEALARISIEEGTRKMLVEPIAGAEKIELRTPAGNVIQLGEKNPAVDLKADRNWKLHDESGARTLTIWLDNGASVDLPVLDPPAPSVPHWEPNEILGQEEMIFTIAHGFKEGMHTLLHGPTGVGKTSSVQWLAKKLGWNCVIQPISRGTESAHLVGEYLPTGVPGQFMWVDGPTTMAVRLSNVWPTILILDELNKIGNVAEIARIYQVLDDTRILELKEKMMGELYVEGQEDEAILNTVEVIPVGELYVVATGNPSDDEMADYVGVQDLDPALVSRFELVPPIGYPSPETEAKALQMQVQTLSDSVAKRMVECARRIRTSTNVRFPISFRELRAWAKTMPFYGYDRAAEITVVNKAPAIYREDIRNLMSLQRVS